MLTRKLIQIRSFVLLALALTLVGLPALPTRANDMPVHRGVITARPSGNTGVWTVGGRSFTANGATEFDTLEGPLTVGACAKVRYFADGGLDIADEIDSEPPQDCGISATSTATTTPSPSATASPSSTPGATSTPQPTAVPIEFKGLLNSRPDGLTGTWVIGGRAFVANAQTEFKTVDGPLIVGACVEVSYFVTGSVDLAREIESEKMSDCGGTGTPTSTPSPSSTPTPGNQTSYKAHLVSRPDGLLGTWVVGDKTFVANNNTEFGDGGSGLAIGDCVGVSYFVVSGQNIAREIEAEPGDCDGDNPSRPTQTPVPGRDKSKVFGIVDSKPVSGSIGIWVIGGISYQANSSTRINSEHGGLIVGACARAEYVVTNMVNVLQKLTSQESYKCRDDNDNSKLLLKAYGVIDVMTTTRPSVWVISGISYTMNASTTLEAEHGPFAVGKFVEVKYVLDGANRIARKIETHVIPGTGANNLRGELELRPGDDWNDWKIGGRTFKADRAIVTNVPRATVGRSAAVQRVIVNYYLVGADAYATTIYLANSQVMLPMLAR